MRAAASPVVGGYRTLAPQHLEQVQVSAYILRLIVTVI